MAHGFPLKMRLRLGGARLAAAKGHEFAWIHGRLTNLVLQDFVGAAFGAMFFVVTKDVWTISNGLGWGNIFAVSILSILMGYLLIYLSRRRKKVSIKLEHTALYRALEIYVVSLLTALIFVLVFNSAQTFEFMAKQAIVIALPAVASSATADLLFF